MLPRLRGLIRTLFPGFVYYAAAVGTSLSPNSGAIGANFWGPRPGHRCTG